MRRVTTFVLSVSTAVALLVPAAALAKPWHSLTPGTTQKSEVLKKFGTPTRELPTTVTYDSGFIYQSKAAQAHGAEEAQFFFDAQGKLTSIFVFPAVALRRDDVIKAYGTAYEERRTDDFRLYFQYRADGFIVFFDKDNESVYQLQFTAALPAAPVKTATIATPPPATPPPGAVVQPTPAPAPGPAPLPAPQ
jgi:hypothetical protein